MAEGGQMCHHPPLPLLNLIKFWTSRMQLVNQGSNGDLALMTLIV